MPEAIAERLHEMTGLIFVEVFGMTETMGPITNNPVHAPKAGCVGIPVMQTDVPLLEVVDSLPKSTAGKMLWRELQDEQDGRIPPS